MLIPSCKGAISLDQRSVPRPCSVRLEALELSSTEAFVLSQIDGAATLDDVADSTGIPLDKVISIACRLEQLGIVENAASASRVAMGGRYADVARPAAESPPQPGAELVHVPRRTAADVYSMNLETGDGFLLSNVDGQSSVQELADILGEDPGRVIRRIDALVRAGVLELGDPRKHVSGPHPRRIARVDSPSPSRIARRSGAHDVAAAAKSARKPESAASKLGRPSQAKLRATPRPSEAARSKTPSPRRPSKTLPSTSSTGNTRSDAPRTLSRADHHALPRHPVLDDAETPPISRPPAPAPKVDLACDLDPETCAKIDALMALPPGRTHYAVLGVATSASTKEISRAYFAVAATVHPDRYFGKRLGPYKKKLEQIFRTASDAYEVLRSQSRRLEYDGYLQLRRTSAQMEAALAPPASPTRGSDPPVTPPAKAIAPPPPPVAPPPKPVPTSTRPIAPPPQPVAPPPQPVVAANAPSAPPAQRIAPPAAPSTALNPPGSKPSVPAPIREAEPPSPSMPPSRISQSPMIGVGPPSADSRPRQSVRGIVATAKSASLLDGAQQALAQGDAISAANLYRLALQYADDPTSRAYAQSGLNEARSIVADMHLKKARYEEKEAHWSEAVASYEKALDRRPDDPAICERLANALRQEGQDLLRAARLAELATNRMPRNAEYRRTLGLVYADAGLREKALEQFEKAFELEPSNEVTTRALASLRRKSR